MALIRFGGGVAEARGSIGGTTFSRNRGGAIARNRTSPINPNTLAQAANRTAFATVVGAWSAMAAKSSVDSWNTFAQGVELVNRLGEAYTPSGRQCFIMVNMPRVLAVQEITTDVPSSPNKPDPVTQLVIDTAEFVDGAVSNIETNVLVADATAEYFLDMTEPLPPGITNVTNRYRRVLQFTPAAGALTLTGPYNNTFPGAVPTADMGAYWRLRQTTSANPFLSAYTYGWVPFTEGL